MKKECIIIVQGKTGRWVFTTKVDTKSLPEWQRDGVMIYDVELEYSVPDFILSCGLGLVWCVALDVFNFRNPWTNSLKELRDGP